MKILLICILGALLAVAATLIVRAADKEAFKNLTVEQFDKMRSEKDTVVLDVRTADEFKAGRIAGSINIDVNAPDFELQVAKLDKSKTYLVHCAAGVRSTKACGKLAPMKFEKLFNLKGGLKAWESAGKPVEKK